ncbi:MAG: hypothetical protein JNJ94_14460 [Chlorobi bacterium]|nr:hypothetical protein [Chlorobiota bacterium]
MGNQPSTLVRLGVLTRTFGLEGRLRCKLDHDVIPQIATPCLAWLGYSATFARPVQLAGCQAHGGDLLCTFDGVATMEAAEGMLDQALFLEPTAICYADPFTDPGIVGYQLYSPDGQPIGEIIGLQQTAAHAVWTVQSREQEWLFPAVPQFVVSLNPEGQTATVRTIPGMMELDEDE